VLALVVLVISAIKAPVSLAREAQRAALETAMGLQGRIDDLTAEVEARQREREVSLSREGEDRQRLIRELLTVRDEGVLMKEEFDATGPSAEPIMRTMYDRWRATTYEALQRAAVGEADRIMKPVDVRAERDPWEGRAAGDSVRAAVDMYRRLVIGVRGLDEVIATLRNQAQGQSPTSRGSGR
jgi:hypothetical protein